jgi:hypothetical protein
VVTTRHYFAIGNRAFDRFGRELVGFQLRLAAARDSAAAAIPAAPAPGG